MIKNKFFIFEKLLFLGIITGALFGFWYFETSLSIKILATILMLIGLLTLLQKSNVVQSSNNRFEMLSLPTIYIGAFTLYNLIANINLPIYIVMIMVLILTTVTAFAVLSMNQTSELMKLELFYSFVLLIGLVATEIFLGLYFWPINVEIKSLVLVIIFYQIAALVYFYARSMLRLNKIVGSLVINFFILAIIFWSLWPKLSS